MGKNHKKLLNNLEDIMKEAIYFLDGAGASIVESKNEIKSSGILSHKSCTFT